MFDDLPLAHSSGPPPPDGDDWPDNWPDDWPGNNSDDNSDDDSVDDSERHDHHVRPDDVRPDDDATEAADQQDRPGTDEPA